MGNSYTELQIISSFLSPDVKNFLINGGSSSYNEHQPDRYFNKCGTFKWSEISILLGNITDDFDIHGQTREWYTRSTSKVWPLFSETVNILERSRPCMLEHLWNLCAWTGKQEDIKEQYNHLFLKKGTTSTLETVLLLTAVLEHSLGKIYLLKGTHVPFLLRDLLSSQELKSTIGIIPVVFMQILFGTPLCLNLRNVVWHGFPSPDELNPHFATVLLVLVASLGEVLHEEGISTSSLPPRSQVVNLHQVSSGLDGLFPDISDYHTQAVNLFRRCDFIAPFHKATWDVIIQHYIDSRYGHSLALILPHMEQLLRCVFCWANNCSQRLLTAQATEFYTTFDEILAENILCDGGNQINALRKVLGDSVIEMLLDMFTYQAGPRIRDKLSHGECEYQHVPKVLVNHMICISLVVVCQLDQTLDKTECSEAQLRKKILAVSESYVPKYHSLTLLKTAIMDSIDKLEAWKTMPLPTPENVKLLNWDEYFKSNDSLLSMRCCLFKIISCKDFTDQSLGNILHDFVQDLEIETLYRPKSEAKFVSLLKRVVDNVVVLCTQVNDVLQEKHSLYNMHKLRSRQRKTYYQIASMCPSLYVAVQCVVILVVIQLLKVNTIDSLDMVHYSNLARLMKDVLKYAENVVSCTNLDKNRWDVVQMLTTQFQQRVDQAVNNKLV